MSSSVLVGFMRLLIIYRLRPLYLKRTLICVTLVLESVNKTSERMVLYSNIVASIFAPFRALFFWSSCMYRQPTMRTSKLYLFIMQEKWGTHLGREFPIIPPNLVALWFIIKTGNPRLGSLHWIPSGGNWARRCTLAAKGHLFHGSRPELLWNKIPGVRCRFSV